MEILGLLDTLESIVLDSSKIPFTKKVMIDEEKMLAIIDKIRLVIQGGSNFAKKAIGRGEGAVETVVVEEVELKARNEGKSVEIIEQAYQMAKEVRDGADKYADEVLSNLEATTSRVLRTVRAGRDRLAKTTQVGVEQ